MGHLYKSEVVLDNFTKAASLAFDYEFNGISVFEGWNKPEVLDDFKIGLIVGPSGSGKSLLLKEFGESPIIKWNENKAIISHFANPNEGRQLIRF